MPATEIGVHLLRAQLPAGTPILRADDEALCRAVSRATLAHPPKAPAILWAALTGGSSKETLRESDRRSCACVARLMRLSIDAAPAEASASLDVAMALYPACADALADSFARAKKDLAAYDYKDSRDYKDGHDYKDPPGSPVAGINNVDNNPDNVVDPSSGLGFPGSPGFAGSSPSGGFALPPPSGTEVTSVVND